MNPLDYTQRQVAVILIKRTYKSLCKVYCSGYSAYFYPQIRQFSFSLSCLGVAFHRLAAKPLQYRGALYLVPKILSPASPRPGTI